MGNTIVCAQWDVWVVATYTAVLESLLPYCCQFSPFFAKNEISKFENL